MKIKQNAQNKNTRQHDFVNGDLVLLKQKKTNKWSTAFEPAFYAITQVNGSSIAARRITDGRDVCGDASQFKLANALIENDLDDEIVDKGGESDLEERRQQILQSANPHSDPQETVACSDPEEITPNKDQIPGTPAVIRKDQIARSYNSNDTELSKSF